MKEGGHIIRNVFGRSYKEAESITIEATKGDLNFISPKGVNFYGKEGGVKFGEYIPTEEEENKKAFAGCWTSDYEGMRNLERDATNPSSNLGETVYYQLTVSNDIPIGTNITFKLWDEDFGDKLKWFLSDDDTFDGKKVYRNAIVREVNGTRRMTVQLFLNPKWYDNLVDDLGRFKNGCLDFYWTWEYNGKPWTSNTNILNVYPSKTTLFIKPAISDTRYGLPEIYSNNGSTIVYAIEKLPEGTVKKFSMIKIRTITTFKFQADINKFKREIYNEAINLDTNRLESVNYDVEEMTSFFNTRKDATKLYIDEDIIEVPIEARGKLAVKNFGSKVIKFAKEAAKAYEQIEILKEMKEMIPELSSNEKFNMPSLSTFVGFVPQLAVFAFGVEVVGWMVAGSLKEVDDIVNESIWADWQNAKSRGLNEAQRFVQSPWAIKNNFKSLKLNKEMLEKLLKGEIKNLEELKDLRENLISKNYDKYKSTLNYTAFYTTTYNKEIEDDYAFIDSIFINQ